MLNTFPQFSRLPVEIRRQIWEYVFSAWTVFSAAVPSMPDESPDRRARRLVTRFIGDAPFLASQSCAGARQVMQETQSFHPVDILRPTDETFGAPLFALDRTVFYLGNYGEMHCVLRRLRPSWGHDLRPHLFGIRHVVVHYYANYRHCLQAAIDQLWSSFVSLETAIFVRMPGNRPQYVDELALPSPAAADYYVKLAQKTSSLGFLGDSDSPAELWAPLGDRRFQLVIFPHPPDAAEAVLDEQDGRLRWSGA
ncbi:hypothetical protein VTJ49DRAFT_4484 [Mycothermus thermophilus]|uniref:2EXR domain-containing protein n=1 Tax=Humicola insolens TaxID=85995 RepID=A0ABR3VLP5_HUMIN